MKAHPTRNLISKAGLLRVLNEIVLLCSVWTFAVGSGWVIEWWLPATVTVPDPKARAGHALLGVVLLITAAAAFAFAAKREAGSWNARSGDGSPRRVDQQRSDGLASGGSNQENA